MKQFCLFTIGINKSGKNHKRIGEGMMSYRILIFNQCPLNQFSPAELMEHLRAVHYSTLCRQYGLNPALISPAMKYFAIDGSKEVRLPYFIVRYQPKNQPPIVVSKVDLAEVWQGLTERHQTAQPLPVHEQLVSTQEAYSLTLGEAQLRDLGLLLAYEIARWLAHRGAGLVFGLDGTWYRLNAYQAFIQVA